MLNENKFIHNFDSVTPLCACALENEDNEHFLRHFPQFHLMRQNLFGQLFHIPRLILNLDDKPLCELLLFGNSQLNVASNRKILTATISFIKNTKMLAKTNRAVAVAIFALFPFPYFFIFEDSIRCLERNTPIRTWPTWPITAFFISPLVLKPIIFLFM